MPQFANPIGSWAVPARIDQGVDYGGAGPLYAAGDGVITNISGPGWPGGTYIILQMDNAVAGARNFFYGEFVSPSVKVGQRVKAGQVIGRATGGGIEIGFSNSDPHRDNTMANQTGQSKPGIAHGDPGYYPTGWGVAASKFIQSLGGKPGVLPGGRPVQGAVPNIGGITPASTPGGTSISATPTGAGGTPNFNCGPTLIVMVALAPLLPVIVPAWWGCRAIRNRVQRRRHVQGHKLTYRESAREEDYQGTG